MNQALVSRVKVGSTGLPALANFKFLAKIESNITSYIPIICHLNLPDKNWLLIINNVMNLYRNASRFVLGNNVAAQRLVIRLGRDGEILPGQPVHLAVDKDADAMLALLAHVIFEPNVWVV
jgi:hypothetical protein